MRTGKTLIAVLVVLTAGVLAFGCGDDEGNGDGGGIGGAGAGDLGSESYEECLDPANNPYGAPEQDFKEACAIDTNLDGCVTRAEEEGGGLSPDLNAFYCRKAIKAHE